MLLASKKRVKMQQKQARILDMKKLIIWDFDGVIADSEKLWVQNWVDMLKDEYNIALTPQQTKDYIIGVSEKTKIFRLKKAFPNLDISSEFIEQIHQNEIHLIDNVMQAMPGIEAIFQDKSYIHCIATGATKDMNKRKLKRLGFDKYFNEDNCFTADMVDKGKPYPDLFLLAAEKMQVKPQECIVIEDAVSGFQAAKAAGMTVIAFVGAENNNNEAYRHICKEHKVDNICSTMPEVHQFLRMQHSSKQNAPTKVR